MIDETFLVLAGLLFFIMPVVAIVALVRSVKLGRRLEELTLRFRSSEESIRALQAAIAAGPPQATPPPEMQPIQPIADTLPSQDAAFVAPQSLTGSVDEQTTAADEATAETPDVVIAEASPEPARQTSAGSSQKTSGPSKGERALAERWMVWLGGLTLALGGGFLVKYSADLGLISPTVRIIMAALGGIGAIVLGHWLSQREDRATTPPATPWFVPAALVGAGSAILFASLFAGYALYDMMPPFLTFGALAAVSAATALLAVRHGPFVALLGLAGGYLVPALVSTSSPSLPGLLAYLLVISAGALALLRWKSWQWLAWVVLGAVTTWVVMVNILIVRTGDEILMGSFLSPLFALFAAMRLGIPQISALRGRYEGIGVSVLVTAAAAVTATLMLFVIFIADWSLQAWAMTLLLALAFIALGWRDPTFDRLPWIAAPLAILGLLSWELGEIDPESLDTLLSFALPRETGNFAWVAALFAALYLAAGLFLTTLTQHTAIARPWRWAALACAMPLMMLATAYSRLSPLVVDLGWSLGAVLFAGFLMVLASRCARSPLPDPADSHRRDSLLATYATGVLAALALAATFALRDAWLTVALSLLPLGMGWVMRMLPVPGLRKVAMIFVAIVMVRLVFNPYALEYATDPDAGLSWIFYGYGLPALSFAWASVLFRRHRDGALVSALEGSAIVFALVMIIRWIHQSFTGDLSSSDYMPYSLAEQSLQTDAVLGAAGLLFLLYWRNRRLIPLYAGHCMGLLAGAHLVLFQMLDSNPLSTGEAVGEGLLINDLLSAYGLPALLLAALFRLAPPLPLRTGTTQVPGTAYGILALISATVWASLEIRQVFSPDFLDALPVGQSELWAYSALYLTLGIGLLIGGIRFGQAMVRKAGLVVILAVVGKVFLIDLSQTEGLWRALSFLALGGCLVGLGFLYRRIATPANED